jgi:hypothetical protein
MLVISNHKEIQKSLIEITAQAGLSQIHEEPTREKNLLDLVFTSTSNPGFYGSVIVIFCVCFWFLCCLCSLLNFADSLGLTTLDSPFGTEVRFLTFFRLVM